MRHALVFAVGRILKRIFAMGPVCVCSKATIVDIVETIRLDKIKYHLNYYERKKIYPIGIDLGINVCAETMHYVIFERESRNFIIEY